MIEHNTAIGFNTLTLDNIQAHTVNALESTIVSESPYQYVCIENLFPEDFYVKLKAMSLEDASRLIQQVFVNESFVKLLFEKFKQSPKRSNVIRSIYAFWQRHGLGYTLKPHVDSYPRVFTLTVYLADNNEVPEAGTAVYEVDRHTKQYKTIGMMPYLRNSCMIICPYDMLTWHGVNMLTEDINRDSTVVVFSALEWNNEQMHYAEWKPGDTVNYEFL